MLVEEENLKARSGGRKFVSNVISLLTSDVLNKATTFLVYALVMRFLGSSDFGRLSLGLLLLYVFQVFATAGLPTVVTRAIAQRPKRTERYYYHGLVTAIVSSLIGTAAMIGLAFVMQYVWETTWVISILAFGLIPYALSSVIESVFRGRERMHFIAIANVVGNVVKVVIGVGLLWYGFGIYYVAILLTVVRWLIFVVEFIQYRWFVYAKAYRRDHRFCRRLFRRSSTFFGIDAITASWSSIDALMLSKFATEFEVGLFCAACQLLQPLVLIYKSVVAAVFPSMCNRVRGDSQNLIQVTRRLIGFLAIIGMPMVVGLIAFSGLFLKLCYGNEDILQATPLLQIVAFTLVIQSLTSVLGNTLWASGNERVALRIVGYNFVVNLVLGLVLISQWNVKGAAICFLVVAIVDGIQHWFAVRSLLRTEPVDATFLVPVFAGGIGLTLIMSNSFQHLWLAPALAIGIYLSIVLFGLTQFFGGLNNLINQFFKPISSP